MGIAGIIERTSSTTLPWVLERIFDREQPGMLRLKHLASGKTARVRIVDGTVQETTFGELKGEAAMKEISATFPWEYEFISGDPGAASGSAPVPRPLKRPALKLAGNMKPAMLNSGEISAGYAAVSAAAGEAGAATRAERKSVFMAARSTAPRQPAEATGSLPGAEPADDQSGNPIPAAPGCRTKQWPDARHLTGWVEQGDEYALRFARSGEVVLGKATESEWEYFRADCASLMLWAAGIGETLGYSAPQLAALVEPQRAAAYRRLHDGFAGIYSGPDTGVDDLMDIP